MVGGPAGTMAEHTELVLEMPVVEKMSTQERLKHAKKRRGQQLKRWNQYEKQLDKDAKKRTQTSKKTKKKPDNNNVRKQRVFFLSNVMLLEAAARNDLPEVRRMLEENVDPDSTNEDGLTALHQCCIDDCEEMMKLLIENRANVNARDSELWTPLHAAATCNHLHLCKYLIDNGAELLAVNADGNMPYDICEDDMTLEYIESEMAARGVTQELIDTTRLSTENNMLNDMRQLASSGGDLEFRDRNGATPLHVAAANGYVQVVELLLDQHVAVDKQDKDLWQPIHAAACWGHPIILEMLVQNGADIEAKTKSGETPYDICEDVEMKDRITEIKLELETNKAVRTLESRYRQRHSTRSSAISSVSSIYNSNTSLSEKNLRSDSHDVGSGQSAVHSSSIRRVSMREKTAISWREAREEAKLRDSANTLDVEEEEDAGEKQDAPEKPQNHSAKLPSSNIDDVTVPATITSTESSKMQEDHSADNNISPSQIFMEVKGTPSPKSKKKPAAAKASPQHKRKSSPASNKKQSSVPNEPDNKQTHKQDHSKSEAAVLENSEKESSNDSQAPVISHLSEKDSIHGSRESVNKEKNRQENGTYSEAGASLGDKNQDKNASMTSLDSVTAYELPTSFSNSKVPSGTLADLKKQRAQRLRNASNHLNLELEERRVSPVPPAEQKPGPPVSNGRTKANGSSQNEPARQLFTAQKTEIVGGNDGKHNCCVIL